MTLALNNWSLNGRFWGGIFLFQRLTELYQPNLFFVLWRQIEEEPEIFGHCSSDMVHTHRPGHIQAFYQVIHTHTQLNNYVWKREIHTTRCTSSNAFDHEVTETSAMQRSVTVYMCFFSLCSVKFMNKIQYVHSLDELAEIVPMEHVHVPECVVQ